MSIRDAPSYKAPHPIFNTKHHPPAKALQNTTRDLFLAAELKKLEVPAPEPKKDELLVIYDGLKQVGILPPADEPEQKIVVIYEDVPNIDLEIEELQN